MKNSILRRLRVYMTGFGIFMGLVFPIYANFFVVWKKGMLPYFVLGCILAGISVGVVSFWFVKIILLKPLIKVSDMAKNIKGKDISGKIEIESNDSVGDIVNGLNTTVKTLRRFICEIEKITALIEAIISNTENENNSLSNVAHIEGAIEIVNEAAKNISTLSQNINEVVTQGKLVVRKSQLKLEDTTNDVKGLSEVIGSMVANSGKVEEIMKLIHDIAFKTNIRPPYL